MYFSKPFLIAFSLCVFTLAGCGMSEESASGDQDIVITNDDESVDDNMG